MNEQAIRDAIVDFNGKSSITKAEFSAWLAGFLSNCDMNNSTVDQLSEVIAMVFKIREETKYIPSPLPGTPLTPDSPWPSQPRKPYNPPRYPGPTYPPIWCDSTRPLDITYKITSSGTGSQNGS